MSGIIADNVGRASGLVKAAGGGGKIGQVVQTVHTGTETATGTTATEVANFSCSITPTATSSKILVMVAATVVCGGSVSPQTQLFRDTTQIHMGDAASSRPRVMWSGYHVQNRVMPPQAGIFLDSPSTTSSIAYTLKWYSQTGQGVLHLNRSRTDNNQAQYDGRAASSITLMEILA